jgi:hypothetical protein
MKCITLHTHKVKEFKVNEGSQYCAGCSWDYGERYDKEFNCSTWSENGWLITATLFRFYRRHKNVHVLS